MDQSKDEKKRDTEVTASADLGQSALPCASKALAKGFRQEFQAFSLSEREIIDYALLTDPLPIHTDPGAAASGHFGGIIASGPQIFSHVHRTEFIPRYGADIIAGIEIRDWKFHGPVRPGQAIFASLEVLNISEDTGKGRAEVHWRYEFKDAKGNLLQELEPIILHRL